MKCLNVNTLALLVLVSIVAITADQYVTPQTRADADKIIDFALAEKTFVYDRLAYVCDTFGPRFSGTPALEAAISSIKATATADGLKVTEEPVSIPRWVRGREYARLLQPRVKDLHFLGLGMSTGTGGKAIQAEVLVVKSFDDLAAHAGQAKGKIIVYNVPFTTYGDTVAYRSQGAVQAAKYGGVAALVRSVGPYGIQTVHTGSSSPVNGVPSGCISAEDASQLQRFQDRGQYVIIELSMEAHMEADVMSRNLIIELPGSDKANEFVLIGGHIDSWDVAEGAMDDGGGVFVSWEAVRIMKQLGLRPRRTIRAIAFVNEENGDRGGIAYALAHKDEMNRTSLAIETDGGTFAPFRLGFDGSPKALPILTSIGTLLARIGAGNTTMGGGGVDISPTCATGVPCAGLQVLDPRAAVGSPINNPCLGFSTVVPQYEGEIPEGYFWFHHTDGDTVDRMDPTQLQLSAASMAVWAYGVAQLDSLLPR